MKIIIDDLREKLPPLYATEGVSDPLVLCRFFLPWSKWLWYAMEFDGEDLFFGYVVGDVCELGYFSLKELLDIRGPLGLTLEEDDGFEAVPLSNVRSLHE
jgi:Protein of unknown function (DUF2958)